MPLIERVIAVLAAALLGACASTAPTRAPGAEPTQQERAAELQVQLGQGYMNQGELEMARDKLLRALELDPHSVAGHTVMAVLQERIGRPDAAEKHYARAVELKPEGGAENNNYGTFLCASGRYADAQVHFERAVADPFYRTPAVAHANSGFCALKNGNRELAERSLRAALQHDPRNATVLFELARLSLANNDAMRARAFLQRFEAISAEMPQALALGAEIEQALGDNAAASQYRRRLADGFPDFSPSTASDGASAR